MVDPKAPEQPLRKWLHTGHNILEVQLQRYRGHWTLAELQSINGGIINIKSADDGLNAGGTGGTITINNGEINIIASGDGIDSNKDAVINGGTIIVSGSSAGGNAAIDTDEGSSSNGGTIIAMGTDMLEAPQASTTQKTLVIALDEVVENDTAFRLYNTETKKTILSEIASSAFKTLILSSKNITNGTYQIEQKRDGSYVVVTAAKNPTFTVSDTITTVGHLSATPGATGDNPGTAPEPR